MAPITKNQVFEIIGRLEAELRALGVSRLAVFGSIARGEARPDSDVDILVQFSPGSKTFDRWIPYLGGGTRCHSSLVITFATFSWRQITCWVRAPV